MHTFNFEEWGWGEGEQEGGGGRTNIYIHICDEMQIIMIIIPGQAWHYASELFP